MICDRCGAANRPGRIVCVQCLGPLAVAADDSGVAHCKEHPDTPAIGKCLECSTLICELCGGNVGNRGLYCINHTPAITSATGASPGMNPLLGGSTAVRAAAARKQANNGLIAAIAGAVGLIVLFVVLFLFPGVLRSKELPPSPATAGAPGIGGGYGMPGSDAYGMPGGYGPPGGPGGYGPPGSYGPPGGPGGYGPPGSYGPPGAPNGPSGGYGPPGAPNGPSGA